MKYLKTFEGKVKWYSKGVFTPEEDDSDGAVGSKNITLKDCVNLTRHENKAIKIEKERFDELALNLDKMKARWANGSAPGEFRPKLTIDGFYYIILRMYEEYITILTIARVPSVDKYDVIDIENIDLSVHEDARVKWYSDGKTEEDDMEYPDVTEQAILYTQKFTDFLVKNDAYDKYLKNYMMQRGIKSLEKVNKDLFQRYKGANPIGLITNTLSYAGTPEGRSYWAPLNDEWNKILLKDVPPINF